MRAAVLAVTIAVAFLGCDQPPAATPQSAVVIPIATQPAHTTVNGVLTDVCMAARLEGRLVRDDRTGLGVAADDGGVVPVRWPNGWIALDTVPVMLVDAEGGIVARVGDRVVIGGGMGADPDETWVACATDIKVVP